MAKLSKESVNGITKFLVTEVQSKVTEGITYFMVLKDGKHDDIIAEYDAVRKQLDEDGYRADEVFRRYELSNGIVYDLDIQSAIALTVKMSEAVAKSNGGMSPIGDMNIAKESEERHREDVQRLAKKVVEKYKEGQSKLEIALFSRNKVPRIIVTGVNRKGQKVACQYDAYAIRHLDIEEVNRDYLSKHGLRIIKIESCEVLPTITGVRCILHVVRI